MEDFDKPEYCDELDEEDFRKEYEELTMSQDDPEQDRQIEKLSQRRGFKGIYFPAKLWLDKSLLWIEKILLLQINSLDKGEGCFASNEYLGISLGLSSSRIAHMISKLRKRRLIIYRKFDGKSRRRWISVNQKVMHSQMLSVTKSDVTDDIQPMSQMTRNNNKSKLKRINKERVVVQGTTIS